MVYCTAISEGNKDDWEFLWGRFKKSDVAAEQVLILNALGCTKDPQVLAVSSILNHSEISPDDLIAFAFYRNTSIIFTPLKCDCKIAPLPLQPH